MLTLYLMRHAKSDWGHPGLADFDRPLSLRGLKAADVMAGYFDQHRLQPSRILCSTACRTRQTLLPLVAALRHPHEIELRRDLYDLSDDTYLDVIRAQGDTPRLMLLAHNTATEMTANRLIADGDPALRLAIQEKYPTGALTELHFAADTWADVSWQSGRLVRFVKPRDLTAEGPNT